MSKSDSCFRYAGCRRNVLGSGGWEWNVKGMRQIPYHLPELAAAAGSRNGHPPRVYVVEGENGRRSTGAVGITTTNAGGAGKSQSDFNRYIMGCDVVILGDNDEARRNHVATVVANLAPVATSVRIPVLAGLKEDLCVFHEFRLVARKYAKLYKDKKLAKDAATAAIERIVRNDRRHDTPSGRLYQSIPRSAPAAQSPTPMARSEWDPDGSRYQSLWRRREGKALFAQCLRRREPRIDGPAYHQNSNPAQSQRRPEHRAQPN